MAAVFPAVVPTLPRIPSQEFSPYPAAHTHPSLPGSLPGDLSYREVGFH